MELGLLVMLTSPLVMVFEAAGFKEMDFGDVFVLAFFVGSFSAGTASGPVSLHRLVIGNKLVGAGIVDMVLTSLGRFLEEREALTPASSSE